MTFVKQLQLQPSAFGASSHSGTEEGCSRPLLFKTPTCSCSLVEFPRMLRTVILGGDGPIVTPYTNTWVIHVSFLPPFLSISSCSASTRPCRLPHNLL